MEHTTTLTQHIHATPDKMWAVITDIPVSAATLSSIRSVQMPTGVARPTLVSKVMMALFGKIGMSITRRALPKDVAEIAAKAESL